MTIVDGKVVHEAQRLDAPSTLSIGPQPLGRRPR
jgi:hypothetical protein